MGVAAARSSALVLRVPPSLDWSRALTGRGANGCAGVRRRSVGQAGRQDSALQRYAGPQSATLTTTVAPQAVPSTSAWAGFKWTSSPTSTFTIPPTFPSAYYRVLDGTDRHLVRYDHRRSPPPHEQGPHRRKHGLGRHPSLLLLHRLGCRWRLALRGHQRGQAVVARSPRSSTALTDQGRAPRWTTTFCRDRSSMRHRGGVRPAVEVQSHRHTGARVRHPN